jgi:hypothetical protein
MRVARFTIASERLGLVVALRTRHTGSANCNVIAGTTNTFRAAMGGLNRSFAVFGASREDPARVA